MRKYILLSTAALLIALWILHNEILSALAIFLVQVVVFLAIASCIIGSIFMFLLFREKYLIVRAERRIREKEADVTIVTTPDGKALIRDTGHAWWWASHLDARPYANSRETYEQPTQEEIGRWMMFNKPTPKLIEGQLKRLETGEKKMSLYDLLNAYPHLMLIGPTGSGKTTVMNTVLGYRLSQYDRARAIWLSTHANLDRDRICPQATIVQKPEAITEVLQGIFNVYLKRRDGAGWNCQLIIALDEWPEIVDETKDIIDIGEILRRLAHGGRKTGINLILASHGSGVEELGIRGHSSVKQDFVQIYLDAVQRGSAIWQKFDRRSSREKVMLPMVEVIK